MPTANSPFIDAEIARYEKEGNIILEIAGEYINGSSPDIGAVEKTGRR